MILRVFTSFSVRILSGWLRSDGAWARAAGRGCSATTLLRSSLLLAGAAIAFAQVTATISGKIEDPSGAGVGAAKVTVRNIETGATRVVSTDESGNYRVLSLALGGHEVKVEKNGFKSAVRSGVNLEVGQEAVVNVHLEVGEFVQEVTVVEATPVVNTTTAP